MADLKKKRRYENLNRLSIEQLEELLRTAPFMPDDQETSEYLDAIEEVILQRETEHPTGRIQDVDSAWAEFREHYLPSASESAETAPEERSEMLTRSVKKNDPYAKKLFRKILPIAATIAVVFMSMIAAQAAGVDVFGSLAHWTEETFHFNGRGGTSAAETAHPQVENETYLAIQAEVDKLDIDVSVVPTWFPDGYELQEIKISDPDMKSFKRVNCLFLNADGQSFSLVIGKYVEDYDISNIVFEKNGQPVTEYLGDDKLFYIMSNNNRKIATWSDGYIVVSISGPLSEETIKTMIDSIAETAHPQVEDETYLTIQAEVGKLGIDTPVVPTWFPDGYELQEIQLPNPDITAWKSLDCHFANKENQSFFLTVAKYVEEYAISSIVFEKDAQPVIEYLGGNKLFYIMSDKDYKTAAWSDGHIVISISGPLTEDTIKTMIDSIGG